MRIEERYRAALVALRDGQWETAATHLLSIAADNPTYRGVDRVLEVLQRTRSVSYWCAAFTIACERHAYEPARQALEQIAALAPSLPRLAALRRSLAEIAPADERQALLQPDIPSAPAEPRPDNTPDFSNEAASITADNTLAGLELDPLTELLFDDRWVELSTRAGSGRPGGSTDSDEAAISRDQGLATVPESSPFIDDSEPLPVPGSDLETPEKPDPMSEPLSEALSDQPAVRPLSDTEPVPLPAEPEGDFIRIVPPTPETEEPEMATDTQTNHDTISPPTDNIRSRHRYSALQLLGMGSFPLILGIVAVYVLFGQGPPTLSDLLRDVQSGAVITSTTELITAIDVQFTFPDDASSVQTHLQEYAGLAAVLAEETPELESALSAWIDTGQDLASARVDMQHACVQAGSRMCDAARQAVAALTAQAEEQRALVCTLTSCPAAVPASVQG